MSKQPPKKTDQEKPMATTNVTPTGDDQIVEKAVENDTNKFLADQVRTLSDTDLNSALKLLRLEVRRRESEREESRPRTGSSVRILKGSPKYVGKVGTAIFVRRSRCFVTVPDISSPAYVLIADLELVER